MLGRDKWFGNGLIKCLDGYPHVNGFCSRSWEISSYHNVQYLRYLNSISKHNSNASISHVCCKRHYFFLNTIRKCIFLKFYDTILYEDLIKITNQFKYDCLWYNLMTFKKFKRVWICIYHWATTKNACVSNFIRSIKWTINDASKPATKYNV